MGGQSGALFLSWKVARQRHILPAAIAHLLFLEIQETRRHI